MASMKDIKRRKSSIQSTQQITKAMKLVSTVKLQKAKGRAEQTNPYFNYMYQTVSSMLAKSGNINHPYLKSGESTKKAVVVITSNRGLAGGYNSNIVKLITGSDLNKEDLLIYAIGNKGREALERRGYHIELEDSAMIESPSYEDAAALVKRSCSHSQTVRLARFILLTHILKIPSAMSRSLSNCFRLRLRQGT